MLVYHLCFVYLLCYYWVFVNSTHQVSDKIAALVPHFLTHNSKQPVYEFCAAADLVLRRLDELFGVDLKNLVDIDFLDFRSEELDMEEEDASPIASSSVAFDDLFW